MAREYLDIGLLTQMLQKPFLLHSHLFLPRNGIIAQLIIKHPQGPLQCRLLVNKLPQIFQLENSEIILQWK